MVEIDIKVRDNEGKVVSKTIEFQPMAEINLAETMRRTGWTINRLADKLGFTGDAIRKMISGNPSLPTIYKFAWAMQIDPRELFFPVDSEGNIISEAQPDPQVLKDQMEGNQIGGIFAPNVQDGQEILHCPHCQTAFLVTNVPHKAPAE